MLHVLPTSPFDGLGPLGEVVMDITFILATSIIGLAASFQMLSSREKERAAQSTKLAQMLVDLKEKNEEVTQSFEAMIFGLTSAMELRDQETCGHSQRVSRMTVFLARKYFDFSPDELMNIKNGALLHDIGKLGIPDNILLKPGFLTPAERKVIERHPGYAKEWLSKSPLTKHLFVIPFSHHERWDGKGYPRGLNGKNIPLESRLFTVVDCADAIASLRPYHKPLPPKEVYAWLTENSGRMFDPEIVTMFIEEDMLRKIDLVGGYYILNEQPIALSAAVKASNYA